MNLLPKRSFITVMLGNDGAIVAFHEGDDLKKKLFIKTLDEETEKKLHKFFSSHVKVPVYFLLDTVEQNYQIQTFPLLKPWDLHQMVKRKLNSTIPSTHLKGSFALDSEKSSGKHSYMFVSTSLDSPIKEWNELLNSIPNRILGIFMVPVEMQNLARTLSKTLSADEKAPKDKQRQDWALLIMHNRSSGMREMAFHNGKLVFTRVLNNNIRSKDFLVKFENDIFGTYEYLKRIATRHALDNFNIITITQDRIKERLNKIKIEEFNLINFTPSEAAKAAGFQGLVGEESKFCDILAKKYFLKSKKLIKFTTPPIKKLENLFLVVKSLYIGSAALIALTFLTGLINVFSIYQNNKKISRMDEGRLQQEAKLSKLKKKEFGTTDGNINEIMDLGKFHNMIHSNVPDPLSFITQLQDAQKNLVRTHNFAWSLKNYKYKTKNRNVKFITASNNTLYNKEGDIESLLDNYDVFASNLEALFSSKEYTLKYSDPPSNINFGDKYYTLNIEVNIEKK